MSNKPIKLVIGRAPIGDDGRKKRRCTRRGTLRRRHIVRIVDDTHEYIYHATKGWRIGKL